MIGNPTSRHAALACLALAGIALTTACSGKPRDNAKSSSTAATSTASSDTVSQGTLGGSTPAESTRTDDLTPSTETRRAPPATTPRRRVARRAPSASVATAEESRTAVTVGVPADTASDSLPATPRDTLPATPRDTLPATPRDTTPTTPVNPPATPAVPVNPDSTPDDPSDPNRIPETPVKPVMPDTKLPTPDSARDTTGRNSPDVTDETDMSPSLANDIRIARLLVVANRLDSAAAALVVRNGSNADVKAFAEMMTRDHGQANQSLLQWVSSSDVTPAVPDATATPQPVGVDELVNTLEGKSGAEFDRAYIEAEIRMHQDAIAKLDLELPQVQNAEIKAALVQARTVMTSHLERARQIQGTLNH